MHEPVFTCKSRDRNFVDDHTNSHGVDSLSLIESSKWSDLSIEKRLEQRTREALYYKEQVNKQKIALNYCRKKVQHNYLRILEKQDA